MKAIVAPTDFSANASLAVDYAARLAQTTGASLMVVHGCTLLDDRYASYKSLIQEANEIQVKTLTTKLQEVKEQVAARWHIEVSVHLFKTENITDCILQLADERADLIVMGTYGNTGLRRKLLGSKAAEVINRSRNPVLTIPPEYDGPLAGRILLAAATYERNEEPFRFVQQLSQLLNSKVYLASFAQPEDAFEVITSTQELRQLGTWASAIFPKDRIEMVNLEGDSFQEAVARYISNNEIGMLAMITRERSFWQNIFDSSLTQELSYVTEVPLLSLRRS